MIRRAKILWPMGAVVYLSEDGRPGRNFNKQLVEAAMR